LPISYHSSRSWVPPPCRWIKVNIDGTIKGAPSHVVVGDIFWDESGVIAGCSPIYLGITCAFQAKLQGVVFPIDILRRKSSW